MPQILFKGASTHHKATCRHVHQLVQATWTAGSKHPVPTSRHPQAPTATAKQQHARTCTMMCRPPSSRNRLLAVGLRWGIAGGGTGS